MPPALWLRLPCKSPWWINGTITCSGQCCTRWLPDFVLPYDYLILATGIQVNYFGHEEWKAIAPGLEALEDADKIRSRILRAFEAVEQMALCGDADRVALQELLTFVLVGGGTVGVELAD